MTSHIHRAAWHMQKSHVRKQQLRQYAHRPPMAGRADDQDPQAQGPNQQHRGVLVGQGQARYKTQGTQQALDSCRPLALCLCVVPARGWHAQYGGAFSATVTQVVQRKTVMS